MYSDVARSSVLHLRIYCTNVHALLDKDARYLYSSSILFLFVYRFFSSLTHSIFISLQIAQRRMLQSGAVSSSRYTLNVKYPSTVCGGKDQLIVTASLIILCANKRCKHHKRRRRFCVHQNLKFEINMKVLILDNVDDLNVEYRCDTAFRN